MKNEFPETSFRELVDTISSGVAVYAVKNDGLSGKDYIILDFNRTALELEGKSKDEVVGRSLFDLRPNIDEFGLIPVFREVWKSGKPAFFPAKSYVDENFSNWYENRIFRLSNNRIVAIYDDVTERKNAEEALRKSEALFREVINSIEKAIAVYEPIDNGRDFKFVEMNKFGESITQYRAEEVLGKSLLQLFPGESSIGLIEKLKETWETGRTTQIPLKQYQDDRISLWVENTLIRLPSGKIIAIFEDTFEQRSAETALRESEEKLRNYIDNAPDGFFIADNSGCYLDVNPAATLITGYSRDELLTMNISNLIPEDSRKLAEAHFTKLINTGLSNGEVPFIRKDGERRIWNVKSVKISENLFMAFTQDMTELRSIQESIRENESRYRTAERIGLTGNWEFNIKTNEFLGSDGAKMIYGFDPLQETFSTEKVESLIPERERVHQALIDLIEHETPYNLEFEILPLGGKSPKTITSIARLIRDENGNPLKVSGVIQDITERKQNESALKASEEKYRKLFNSIRDAILVADTNRNITDCNQAFIDLFGYSRSEIINKKTSSIYKDKAAFLDMGKAISDHNQASSSFIITISYQKKDKTTFPGETKVFYLHDDAGSTKGFIGLIRDVSSQILLEEQIRQSQKMEAIGQLAGGVAHDFNNLLTIINGYSDMLLDGKKQGESTYEELQQIRQAGSRAAALTGQLLAFSRKQVLEPKILDVNLLIARTKEMLRRIIGEDIDLVTHYDASLAAIRADPGQFDQIILNLAVNARDAMPRGGKLTIETRNALLPDATNANPNNPISGKQVLITISDNGPGMNQKTLNRIFEPFFTTKKAGKGTGMGLSMVYGIVKQSGGEIQVFSKTTEPGRGTSFKIYFPAVEDPAATITQNTDTRISLEGKETILVVEDEAPVRKLIGHTLSRYGYKLIMASGGSEAQELIKSVDHPIHLLLTDVIMPGMSGRELADIILKTHPDIQVCFMSGYTDDAISHHGILDQDLHFIQKPFLPSKLTAKIREILNSDL